MIRRLLATTALLGAATVALAQAMTEGEVRKIDTAQNKITIKHGEIKHLDMPPMGSGMVFRVKDPALLGKVKEGDKVRFMAEKIGSAYTVTAIEVAK
jgi:Cu(I)/Ag(I) efflux system protein CusF